MVENIVQVTGLLSFFGKNLLLVLVRYAYGTMKNLREGLILTIRINDSNAFSRAMAPRLIIP